MSRLHRRANAPRHRNHLRKRRLDGRIARDSRRIRCGRPAHPHHRAGKPRPERGSQHGYERRARQISRLRRFRRLVLLAGRARRALRARGTVQPGSPAAQADLLQQRNGNVFSSAVGQLCEIFAQRLQRDRVPAGSLHSVFLAHSRNRPRRVLSESVHREKQIALCGGPDLRRSALLPPMPDFGGARRLHRQALCRVSKKPRRLHHGRLGRQLERLSGNPSPTFRLRAGASLQPQAAGIAPSQHRRNFFGRLRRPHRCFLEGGDGAARPQRARRRRSREIRRGRRIPREDFSAFETFSRVGLFRRRLRGIFPQTCGQIQALRHHAPHHDRQTETRHYRDKFFAKF